MAYTLKDKLVAINHLLEMTGQYKQVSDVLRAHDITEDQIEQLRNEKMDMYVHVVLEEFVGLLCDVCYDILV